MALPFLHKFRAQNRTPKNPTFSEATDFKVSAWDWPLSMIGPDGPQLLNFRILGLGETAPRKAGIFIYAKRTPDNQWQALYIGESSNLQNRLAFNEIAADALLSGATDIHVLLLDVNASSRRDLCEKLVFTNRPPLNEDARSKKTQPAASRQRSTKRQSHAA